MNLEQLVDTLLGLAWRVPIRLLAKVVLVVLIRDDRAKSAKELGAHRGQASRLGAN